MSDGTTDRLITTGLTDEQLRAIGHVASEWAHLEYSVHDGFAAALNGSFGCPYAAGRVLAANIGRIETIFKIIKDIGLIREDQVERFDRNWGRVGPLSEERNRVIHGTWYRYLDDPDTLIGKSETRKRPSSLAQQSARDIDFIAKRINHAAFELSHFFREKPWPGKDRE